MLDFSASLNPFPPEIPWDATIVTLDAYPDDTYQELRELIAKCYRRDAEEVSVGNGSIEVIRSFCASVFSPGDRFWLQEPTFGEYAGSARFFGAEKGRSPEGSRAWFLCNPNNPTGELQHRHRVLRMLEEMESDDSYLFVDEAFMELADPRESVASCRSENLVVAKSLTKSFAVPGIRFGFALASEEIAQRMEAVRLPWSVNAYAESFALIALEHLDALERSRELIGRERRWLEGELQRLGLEFIPSSVNYILISLPGPAAPICAGMLARDILVRDCTSFGLPSAIRVAVRKREENEQLVGALESCLR